MGSHQDAAYFRTHDSRCCFSRPDPSPLDPNPLSFDPSPLSDHSPLSNPLRGMALAEV